VLEEAAVDFVYKRLRVALEGIFEVFANGVAGAAGK
jgi:hypothetical protein